MNSDQDNTRDQDNTPAPEPQNATENASGLSDVPADPNLGTTPAPADSSDE